MLGALGISEAERGSPTGIKGVVGKSGRFKTKTGRRKLFARPAR